MNTFDITKHIAIGSDHAGIEYKEKLKSFLASKNRSCKDFGTHDSSSVDYPDYAHPVAIEVESGYAAFGILICGTGIGMCIAANKIKGIRAALAQDELSAQLSRTHNDANVLCLSADLLGQTLMKRIVDIWFRTAFDGGRHERRLAKIAMIENGNDPSTPKSS